MEQPLLPVKKSSKKKKSSSALYNESPASPAIENDPIVNVEEPVVGVSSSNNVVDTPTSGIQDKLEALLLKIGYKEGLSMFIKKALIGLWCLAVVLAVLSLLGFHPTRIFSSSGLSNENPMDNPPDIPEIPNEDEDESLSMVAASTTGRKKFTKKQEIQFACDEVDCQEKCHKKASPKCSKSAGCMRERAKICQKRCRKARCEARCKDEPQLGYVEREMKLEKCKEECQSARCKARCEEDFKSCKLKCREKANKYVCDIVKSDPLISEASSTVDLGDDDEDSTSSSFSAANEDGGGDSSDDLDSSDDDPL